MYIVPLHVYAPPLPFLLQHMGMPPSMAGAGRGVVGSPGGPGGVEVWFEHKTADGRMYYSHPQTQKTTWERPPGAHIVPQPPAGWPFHVCYSLVPRLYHVQAEYKCSLGDLAYCT